MRKANTCSSRRSFDCEVSDVVLDLESSGEPEDGAITAVCNVGLLAAEHCLNFGRVTLAYHLCHCGTLPPPTPCLHTPSWSQCVRFKLVGVYVMVGPRRPHTINQLFKFKIQIQKYFIPSCLTTSSVHDNSQ